MAIQQNETEEIIIRFSSAWWSYMVARGGVLRVIVNGIEDALAITGRFLLLLFLIYCGAKAGLLLVNPKFQFDQYLEMTMFILQLAGLEGSIPGLARQADVIRASGDEEAAKKVEFAMGSARTMTVLSIAEGALHALHIPPDALQIISALLLVARGVVITGFLIELAKVEKTGPRVLSKDEHASEAEAKRHEGEQAQTITQLRQQVEQTTKTLDALRVEKQQKEQAHTDIITQLREQVKRMEATHSTLLQTTQDRLQSEITESQKQQEQAVLQVADLQRQLQDAQKNGSSLHLSWQEKELSLKAEMEAQQTKMEAQKLSLESQMKAQMEAQKLSLKAEMEAEVKAQKLSLQAKMEAEMKAQQEQLKAEMEALQQANAHLKAKMKAQTEAPAKPAAKVSSEKFDARQFVFSCLRESPDLKILEIALKAKKQGQELSEPTISRYRKEYRESSNESSNESSAM